MKFILMMNAPKGDGDWNIMKWPAERMQAHFNFMMNLNVELRKEGVLASCEGLAAPSQARIVKVGANGGPEVTDGPFAESKEFLAGYWIVDVESAEQAYAIAARASAAPDINGKPMGIPIEVRQVMSAPTAEASEMNLLRELAPQVLGIVCRRYGDFEAAEDAVQEALLAASLQWPKTGVPENPRAWLIHVANNRMTDQLRAEIARRKRETKHVAEVPDDEQFIPPPDAREEETDDTLLLLFMCCHESLSRTSAIALTLRAVGGLTTAEIAHAFLVPEATMAQRISRAKQLIKKSGVRFRMPTEEERDARLESVLHVLYLVFNEGYASSEGAELARVDLSSEAIRLARAVRHLLPNDGEVSGLLALMLLTDARRHARTGASGEIIPLDEQDRSTWDRAMIDEGVELISATLSRGAIGAYQLQAAIAAVHDEAKTADATDWPQILVLYGLLERMTDNPMVTLNRAIAAAMVHGPARGLELLAPLDQDPRLANHHRLAAVRGHLHEKLGQSEQAIAEYHRAAERTASLPERNYLLMKAARLSS